MGTQLTVGGGVCTTCDVFHDGMKHIVTERWAERANSGNRLNTKQDLGGGRAGEKSTEGK